MSLKQLFESYRQYLSEEELIESRLTDIKKKYPDIEGYIGMYANEDPSGKNKYLGWFAKQLDNAIKTAGVERSSGAKNNLADALVKIIAKFHKNVQRLKIKDINQYKTYEDLRDDINALGASGGEKRKKQKETAMEGSEVIFQDENFFVVRPDTEQASCYYGKGTKWCISATTSRNYFGQYTGEGKMFYMLRNENLDDDDPGRKLAFVFSQSQGLEEIYNAPDNSIENDDAYTIIGRNILGISEEEMEERDIQDDAGSRDAYHAGAEAFTDIEQLMADHATENAPNTEALESAFEEIQAAFDARAEHTYVSHEFDDYGEGTYVDYRGGMSIAIDTFDWLGDSEDHKDRIQGLLSDALTENNVYVDDIEVDIDYDTIRIDFTPDHDEGQSSNDFESFTNRILEYDKEYDAVIQDFTVKLEDEGLIAPSNYSKLKKMLNQLTSDEIFRNLTLDVDDEEIVVRIPMRVNIGTIDRNAIDFLEDIVFKKDSKTTNLYLRSIKDILSQAQKISSAQLSLFESLVEGIDVLGSNHVSLMFKNYDEKSGIIIVDFYAEFKRETEIEEEDVRNIYEFFQFLDENVDEMEDRLIKILGNKLKNMNEQKSYHKTYNTWQKYLKG